nr:reverse transcriptase domain-containing protein [Tanacetum cinerariifolium]
MTAVKRDGLNLGSAKYNLGIKSVQCVHGKMIGVDESPVDFSGTFSINDDSNSNEETGIPPSFASLIDDESFVRRRFRIGLVFLFPCRQYWKLMLVLRILFIGYFIGKKLAVHKSSSRLTRDQSSNPTSSTNTTPKGRNRRSSKQRVENSNLEEHLPPVVTMTDNRTMTELLHAPTEGYAEAIVVSPIVAEQFELKHSLINMMATDQFFGLEKDNPHDHIWAVRRWLEKEPPHSSTTWDDLLSKFINELFPPSRTTNLHQDSLNAATGGNLLERNTQDVLTIIENKSKVRNSRSKPIASQVKACDVNSNSEIAKLTHAVNQQTSVVTTAMTFMLKQFQATQPPDSVKAVEETCVTCRGAHPYYQCLATGGNTFPELRDNIQVYVLAAAVNYNQGNPGYRPQGIANQIRPPAQQNQNFHLNELEKIKRMNEANMKAMQTQIDMVKNELRTEMKSSIQTSLSNQTNEIKNMMASHLQMNTASTLTLGSLPSNTVANPKGELKAITTRSVLVTDGPTVPTPPKSSTPKVGERVEETFMDPDLTEYTIKVPPPPTQKYKPPAQREFVVHKRDPLHSNILYPSRMLKQKQQEKDEVQIQKFWQMFKQLHINITLADALVLTPKYQKMLKALLSNKEKLQELANTPLNENCSAVILKKLPEKLRDPGKFLIPCGFSELKCKALADLGASINLMPLSVWKKLGLLELIPTRMTLELANRVICTPAGIARDVFVPVGKFTFPTDFVIVDYESDLRVPLILGRPLLRTARALIDVHESINLINVFKNSSEDFLEVLFSNQPSGNPTFSPRQELTSPKVNNDIFDLEGCNFLYEKLPDLDSTKDLHPPLHDNPLSDSTTYFSNSLLEEFADERPPKYDDNLQFDIESDLKEIEFLIYQDKDSSLKDSIDQKGLASFSFVLIISLPLKKIESSLGKRPGEAFCCTGFIEKPSGNLTFSLHPELTSPEVNHDIFDSEGCNVLSEKLPDLDSTKDLHPPLHDNPLSGSTTYFSNSLLEEFADELPQEYDDNLQFDIESDLKEIEFLLYQDKDSSLKDSIDQKGLANLDDIFVDSIPEMFTNEHAHDYSSPSIFDVYDDDFLEVESDAGNVYDDPFDSKEEKIKESKFLIDELDLPCDLLPPSEYDSNVYDDPFDSKEEKIKESKFLIDELDLPCDLLPPSEYDSFISQDFSRVDGLPSTNNEDKVFNPGILIQEKPIKIITRVFQDKKLAISNASLVLEDFDPPFYEPLFFKEVPKSKMLLLFSSKNEEKFSNQGYTLLKSIPGNVKTLAKGFCTQLFISSASYWESPARLGCAEMKVATWDDLAFKLITLGWNVKH